MTALSTLFGNEYGILFLFFALLGIIGAIVVIFGKRVMHSLIGLLVALLAVAGMYLILESEFLFAMQMIVYTGGIAVLFLFGVLLVGKEYVTLSDFKTRITPILLGLSFGALLIYAFTLVDFTGMSLYSSTPTVETLRKFSMFSFDEGASHPYVYAFVFVALLLTSAFLGAVKLVKKNKIPQEAI